MLCHFKALAVYSAPCRARTYDPLIKSQPHTQRKSKQASSCGNSRIVVTYGVTQTGQIDLMLQRLIDSLHTLPKHTRQTIETIVDAAQPQKQAG